MGDLIKNSLSNKIKGATGVISIDGSLVDLLRKVTGVVVTPTGYTNDVMGVGTSNISHIMGVETGDIDKVMGV